MGSDYSNNMDPYSLLNIITNSDFKIFVKSHEVAKNIASYLNSLGTNVNISKKCPVTNAANILCKKYKGKKLNKEKFIKKERDWLANHHLLHSSCLRTILMCLFLRNLVCLPLLPPLCHHYLKTPCCHPSLTLSLQSVQTPMLRWEWKWWRRKRLHSVQTICSRTPWFTARIGWFPSQGPWLL